MKTKTAFQFLKAELQIPRQIIVDDADGTRMNNVTLGEIMNVMEKFAEQEKSKYFNLLTEISIDASSPCGNNIKHVRIRKKLIDKAEKLLGY